MAVGKSVIGALYSKIVLYYFVGIVLQGASNSNFVSASYPILLRYRGVFSFNNRYGDDFADFGTRATVVCGAGLLYEKRYRKMQNVTTDNQFSGSHFSIHFFQKQTEKWLSENRSSVLCTVKLCYTIL